MARLAWYYILKSVVSHSDIRGKKDLLLSSMLWYYLVAMGIHLHLGYKTGNRYNALQSVPTLQYTAILREHASLIFDVSDEGVAHLRECDFLGVAKALRYVATQTRPATFDVSYEDMPYNVRLEEARANSLDALANMLQDVVTLRDSGFPATIYGA
jgi:hypothetical protein